MYMQNADGQVLIRAELDTAAVLRGIAEMKAALNEMKSYAARQFSLIRSQTQTESNAILAKLPSLAGGMIGTLAGGISGGGATVGGALRDVLGTALRDGINYAAQFHGVGSYVISGIIRGIQGASSSLWNTLRGVASNMLATLKNALGIASPSRVMREEVGRPIGAGIAAGMLDGSAEITDAAKTLTDRVRTAAVPPRTSAASPAAAFAGAAVTTGAAVPAAEAMTAGAPSVPLWDSRFLPSLPPTFLAAAGTLLASDAVRAAPAPLPSRSAPSSDGTQSSRPAPTVSGNTFIFEKPVETPYRHAQAIRETMEEMLYGI